MTIQIKEVFYSKLNQMTSLKLTTLKSIVENDRGGRRKVLGVPNTVMRMFVDHHERRIKSPISGSRGKKKEQQNNVPSPKKSAAAGYNGPVKIELLKGAGLLLFLACQILAIKFSLFVSTILYARHQLIGPIRLRDFIT